MGISQYWPGEQSDLNNARREEQLLINPMCKIFMPVSILRHLSAYAKPNGFVLGSCNVITSSECFPLKHTHK